MTLLLPTVVAPNGVSSWQAHINRTTPSREPGTDLYVPTGTRIIAPADGEIWGSGVNIDLPEGRWVGINFANGMSFRTLHNRELLKRSGRVFAGDDLAISGSSGYGSEYFGEPTRNDAFYRNTGGDHTHVTLWPTWGHFYGYRQISPYRIPYTIDMMPYVGGSAAGGGSTPFPEEGFLVPGPLADAQIVQMYHALVEGGLSASAYYKPDQITQILTATRDGLVARTDATNTTLGTIMQMLRELDPAKTADLGEFERMLRESEARSAEATKTAIEGSTVILRAEIVAALAAIAVVDPDEITAAVDRAFDRVFVRQTAQ